MNRAQAKNKAAGINKGLPDKLFYKIGEVSRVTKVEPYVLRYWETEFPFLRPRKNKSGQRVYVKKDLEQIIRIKGLLYDEKYTIEGVRLKLESEGLKQTREVKTPVAPADALQYVRNRLREILDQIR